VQVYVDCVAIKSTPQHQISRRQSRLLNIKDNREIEKVTGLSNTESLVPSWPELGYKTYARKSMQDKRPQTRAANRIKFDLLALLSFTRHRAVYGE